MAAALFLFGFSAVSAQDRPSAVRAVEVTGNQRVALEQILTQIGITAGDSVVAADIERAMRRVALLDRSADSRLHGSCAAMTPSFIVLLRGSKAARMRSSCLPPASSFLRRPSSVARIAVG